MSRPSLLDRLALPLAAWHARRQSAQFLAAIHDARRTQERVLLEKVRRNADSDYGREHSFAHIRSPTDFISRVPITTYEMLAPYVERLKRGDLRALLGPGQQVLMFALTSGTTREPKYVPVTPAFLAEYRRGWNVWGLRALLDHPGCFLRSIVQVSSPMNEQTSEAGIPCGAITGLMAATQKRLVRKYYTSPLSIAQIGDALAKYYTIMRLAIPRDVAFLVAANPSTLLLLAHTADEHRESLIRDVHDGTLGSAFEIPASVRDALRPALRPDPETAARLARLVATHGRLLPRHYWSLGFVAHWTGGTMGLYRSRFPEWFGDVPVRDPGLLASEGRMSIPIEDNTAAGVLDVTSHFFEFIPAEDYESPQRRAIGLADVDVDSEYFLLLTTSSGFCRYDIGDRVRVVGRLGEAPIVEFLSKGAHTSSLAGEKLTEHQVVTAMAHVAAASARRVEQFILAPQFADPPYYRLYIEADPATPKGLAEHTAAALDDALSSANVEYASKRKSLRLGPIQAATLPSGSLARVDAHLRARQAGRSEQFKHRYLMSDCGAAEQILAAANAANS